MRTSICNFAALRLQDPVNPTDSIPRRYAAEASVLCHMQPDALIAT